jgi:uncharacterized protein (TIRG00374 family)
VKKGWRIILLAVGLALFAWFIQRTGWADIRNTFAKLGPWMLVALAPYAVVFTIDCVGWRFTFGPAALKGIPFRVVWSIRLIGEAINNVIPSMYVGGEAVKVGLLKRRGVPVVTAASAAVRSKTAQSVAQSTFIAMGAAVAAVALPTEHTEIKWAFAAIALLAFTCMALLFRIQRHGLCTTLIGWVRRLGFRLKSLEPKEQKIRELDDEIYVFYNRDKKYFRWCTLTYLAGWMFDTVEIMVVAHLLGAHVTWADAFAIEAFISVARGFNTVVPGALGVQEFSVVGLFTLFGYGHELGAQYAIVRRGRDVIFAALGWGLLYAGEATWKSLCTESQAEDAS